MHLVRSRNLLLLFPIALVASCIFITSTALFEQQASMLSKAITFDLLLTTPLLYFLIIRKQSIPNTTVIPVFLLGIVIASIVLPTEHQVYLNMVKIWFLPVLEVGVLVYLTSMIYKGIRLAREAKDNALDFHDVARIAVSKLLNDRLGSLLATELSMLYYLLSWKKTPRLSNTFTYHKTTSSRLLLGVFAFLVIIETIAVHLLLQRWSMTAAWILTIISGYTVLQLLSIARSVSRRPILLTDNQVRFRWGFMQDVTIPLEYIETATLHKKEVEKQPGIAFLSPFQSAEGHNVKITLHQEAFLQKLYGFKSSFTTLYLHADQPEKLVDILNSKIEQ